MSNEAISPLYGPKDMNAIMRQVKHTLWGFLAVAAIAVAGIVASLVYRLQWVTIGITLIWGAATIFFWSMKMTPPLAYRKHLKEIQSGLSRATAGTLVEISPDLTFREGLNFHAVTLNIGSADDPEDDRLFYWDHQKPIPQFVPGERVEITSHGNDIIGIRAM